MQGDHKGLIVNSTDICRGTHKAKANLTGQNGKLDEFGSKVTAQCKKSKRYKKKSAGTTARRSIDPGASPGPQVSSESA
jgi:hypothetical protein